MTFTQKDVTKIRVSILCGDPATPEVTEIDAYALPTVPGLAVGRGMVSNTGEKGWYVFHIRSQRKIGRLWPTAAKALDIVQKLTTLADWTQDRSALDNTDLSLKVRMLYRAMEG
jgi:hypothetical protein